MDAKQMIVEGQAIQLKDEAVRNAIADEYDSTSTYSVGDYCIYGGVFYRCTTAVTTAESFDSTKWTTTQVGDELLNIENEINGINSNLTNYIKEVYDTTTVTTNENTNTSWNITYTPPSGYTLITAFVVTYGQGTTCILSAESISPTTISGFVRRIRGTGDVTLPIRVCSLWRKL